MKPGLKRILLSLVCFLFVVILFYAVDGNRFTSQAHAISHHTDPAFPSPRGNVNDFVELFTEIEARQLDSMIKHHELETGNQIAIVIIDSNLLGDRDIEQYFTALGNNWGVGQKNRNNGVIIGIVPFLRKITIRTGHGIERIMTDTETKAIIDSNILPHFKDAQYFEGVKAGLTAIFEQLK